MEHSLYCLGQLVPGWTCCHDYTALTLRVHVQLFVQHWATNIFTDLIYLKLWFSISSYTIQCSGEGVWPYEKRNLGHSEWNPGMILFNEWMHLLNECFILQNWHRGQNTLLGRVIPNGTQCGTKRNKWTLSFTNMYSLCTINMYFLSLPVIKVK